MSLKARKRRKTRRQKERELANLTDAERDARLRSVLTVLDQQRKDAQ